MRFTLGILIATFILTSCKNEVKTEIESESKNSKTQSKFIKIETNNSLELEYKILDENDEIIEFNRLHKMAEYPGGFDSLATFIQRNFKFPETVKDTTILGIVKTSFSVDTLGRVVEVKIVNGLMEEIDKSCLEVIIKMPNWKPAELSENKKVKMLFGLPLKFVSNEETE